MLTCDVSGAAGSPITYIADVSGEHTDGVGGVVRVTGSDNDLTATRTYCILAAVARSYRTFRGFTFDTVTINQIAGTNVTYWIIEDCSFEGSVTNAASISISGASQLACTIQRCVFVGGNTNYFVLFTHGVAVNNTGHLVQDCLFISGINTISLRSESIGGIILKNSTIISGSYAVRIGTALTVGQTVTVNDCIVCYTTGAFRALVLGEIVENFNAIWQNGAYVNVAVGANTITCPPLFEMPILHSGASQVSGFRFPPPLFGALSQWSQVRAIADTGAATEDILGLTRPVTAGKRSWGAVQYQPMVRDTGTVRTGTASMKLSDAGRFQIYVPTTNVSTVFSVYVYREANYAGVNPQLIVKQPGQADTVVTDAGAAGAWNQLTTTLTPAALPGYVVVELVSGNTAAVGAYSTFFDDLTVV